VFITLTYGRDAEGNESHLRSSILTYSDVQKYFKTLRNRGFKFRYLVVGELGEKKGRTHWHVIIFFEEKLPAETMDYGNNSWHRERREVGVPVRLVWHKKFNEPMWPHGWSQWDPLHYGHEQGGVRYACKYINKDIDDESAQSKLCMSKAPPIGAVYFDKRAKKLVDEGVSPQDPYYTFPNQAKRKNGDIVRFKLAARSLELFIENYIRRWLGFPPFMYHGPPTMERGERWPESQMIEDYLDKKTRDEWDRETEALVERLRPARRWEMAPPMGYLDRDIIAKSLPHDPYGEGSPMVETPDGPMWYGPNSEGICGWRNVAPETVWKPKTLHQHQHPHAELSPRRTQSQWVEHLAPRCVFWITLSVANRGKHKLAKTALSNGKRVWLRSMI